MSATLVILGATGSLARRKLVPALYHLATDGDLPAGVAVVGVGRRAMTDEQFRAMLADVARHAEAFDRQMWEQFARRLHYVEADLGEAASYPRLRERLDALTREAGLPEERLYDLAVPPSLVRPIIAGLRDAGLTRGRLVVEKPFGRDLASARALNAVIAEAFPEERVYRIDHYLGKDTVQNLVVFRFANTIFEPIWNRRYVEHVQITVAEEIGIEDRGAFYEETGVVRDVLQNHAMQLLALVAMEPPSALDAESLRDEKARVLRAVPPVPPEHAVRGQYGRGVVRGQAVGAYREEEDVAPDSIVPTYAALRLEVANWRWAGVPFYLRAGKRLARAVTEVRIQFQRPPLLLFDGMRLEPNALAINIQPEASISLRFEAKSPEFGGGVEPVEMRFGYGASERHGAYEHLLLDLLAGDRTMFIRQDEVERAWAILDPVLRAWEQDEVAVYPAGSPGPAAADALLARSGHTWQAL